MSTKSKLVTVMLLAGAGAALFFYNNNGVEKEKEDIDVTSRHKIENEEYGEISPSLVGDPDSNPDPEAKSENTARKKHLDTLGMTDYPDENTQELPPSALDHKVIPKELAELESGNASTPVGEVIPDDLAELESRNASTSVGEVISDDLAEFESGNASMPMEEGVLDTLAELEQNIASEEYIQNDEEYIQDNEEYLSADYGQGQDDLAELERNIASEEYIQNDEEYLSADYGQGQDAGGPVPDDLAELERNIASEEYIQDNEEYLAEDYDQDGAASEDPALEVLDDLAEIKSTMSSVGEVPSDELRFEEEGLSADERVFEDMEPE